VWQPNGPFNHSLVVPFTGPSLHPHFAGYSSGHIPPVVEDLLLHLAHAVLDELSVLTVPIVTKIVLCD